MRGFTRCAGGAGRAGRAGARRIVATLVPAVLTAGLLAGCAGVPSVAHPAPSVSPGVAVKGLTVARPKKIKVVNQADRKFRATRTAWPAAAAGTAVLRAPSAGQAAGPPAGVRRTPVWMQAVA